MSESTIRCVPYAVRIEQERGDTVDLGHRGAQVKVVEHSPPIRASFDVYVAGSMWTLEGEFVPGSFVRRDRPATRDECERGEALRRAVEETR